MINTKSSFYLLVLLLVGFAFFPSVQEAFAVGGVISDQTSCESITVDGTWIGSNTCQVNNSLSINNGETLDVTGQLKIAPGATVTIQDTATLVLSGNGATDGLWIQGTLEHYGLIDYTGTAGLQILLSPGIWNSYCGVVNGGPPITLAGGTFNDLCTEEIIFPLTEITADIHISNVIVDGDPIGNPGQIPITFENDLLITEATLTSPYYIQNFALITFENGFIDTNNGGTVETFCSNSDFRGTAVIQGTIGQIFPNFINTECDEPTGVIDTGFTTAEDTPSLPIDVLSNDLEGDNSDIDNPRDDTTLSVYSVTPGTNGVVTTDGNTVTYTPNADYNGPDSFTYTIIDGNDVFSPLETSVSITVTPVPDPPVLDPIGPQSIDEGVELTFTATASSVDVPPNTLTFSLVGAPAGATIQTTGEFTWTPSEGQTGDFTFDVVVSDGQGGTDFETITVTVTEGPNNPPVLDTIGNQSIDEGVELTFTATALDADIPADTLTFSLVGAPAGATIQTTGEFTWTPSEGQTGDFTFDVVVSDGQGGTDFETITVTASAVNQAPVLDPIGDKSIEEETLLTFTATATDADLPADTFTFSLVDGTSGSIPAGATIDEISGVFTFTPTESQVGPFTFDVVVTDDGIPPLSDFETITVTVTEGPNNPPVLDTIGNQSIDEGVELTFTATATDADVPPNTLVFSLSDGTGLVPAGAAIDGTTGVFSWTPSEGQTGVFTFDVVATDDGIPPLSDFETITVTVSVDNQDPVLDTIGNQSIDEGVELTFTATASDADVPANTFTFSLVDGTSGSVPAGATIDGTTGVFSWTPSIGQTGVFTFDVVVTDDGIPPLSDFETITVTVSVDNQAPVLDTIGDQTVDELVELTFTATALDADIPADILTFSLVGAPLGATIDGTTGAFTWTPSEGQTGVFTFDVVVDDGQGGTDFETITVTVSAVNQAPVLDTIGDQTVDELVELTFTATALDADIPADILTFSLVGAPLGATIDGTTGVFTWTPSELQGPDVFTFNVIVNDGNDGTDSETITITVNEVNIAPVCFDPTVDDDSLWPPNHKMESVTVAMSATDDDGDSLSISIISIFQDEAVTGIGEGNTSPDAEITGDDTADIRAERSGNENGRVYTITVQADDGNGGVCSGEVTVGVPHDKKGIPVDDGANFDSTEE